MLITTMVGVTTIDQMAILHFRIKIKRIALNLKSTEIHNLDVNLFKTKNKAERQTLFVFPSKRNLTKNILIWM